MASLNFLGDFKPEDEPEAGFTPIPSGDYKVVAESSEMKQTQSGGNMLAVRFKVLDGQYQGRILFANFNLQNKNPDAVRIARAEFASLCRAANVFHPKDSAELHNKPVKATVGIEKRKDTGDLQNRIKGYGPLNGQASAGQPVASSAAATQPQQESAPWEA